MNNKIVIKDGKEINFSMEVIELLVNDELYDYSRMDKNIIVDCIGHLVADLDVSDINEDVSVERYYFDAVKSYLEDDHTVYELDNIEDDAEVFEYCR